MHKKLRSDQKISNKTIVNHLLSLKKYNTVLFKLVCIFIESRKKVTGEKVIEKKVTNSGLQKRKKSNAEKEVTGKK